MSDRDKLAETITDLIMEHLPNDVDLRLREWYELSAFFSFGADGFVYVDNPSLMLVVDTKDSQL